MSGPDIRLGTCLNFLEVKLIWKNSKPRQKILNESRGVDFSTHLAMSAAPATSSQRLTFWDTVFQSVLELLDLAQCYRWSIFRFLCHLVPLHSWLLAVCLYVYILYPSNPDFSRNLYLLCHSDLFKSPCLFPSLFCENKLFSIGQSSVLEERFSSHQTGVQTA